MFSALLVLTMIAPLAGPEASLETMTAKGLEIPGVGRHRLQSPTLAVGLAPAKIKEALEPFIQDRPEFLERHLNAPYRLDQVVAIKDKEGKDCGREINLWFVVHGKMKDLEDQNLMGSLLGMQGKDKGKEPVYLTEAELKERNIPLETGKGIEERYWLTEMGLIDRIQISGVMRTRKQNVDGGLVTTMILDDRFAEDKKYPNRWRAIKEGEDKTDLGPPNPYRGFGGYVKATPLPDPEGAILIEMHFAFSEPEEWFEGRNLLASKLPLAVRNNVTNLRRKLSGKR